MNDRTATPKRNKHAVIQSALLRSFGVLLVVAVIRSLHLSFQTVLVNEVGFISYSDVVATTLSIGWVSPKLVGYRPNETAMVFVTHSERSSYDDLQGTVRDALQSPQAAVFVYTSSMRTFERLRKRFGDALSLGRLAIQLTETVNVTELGQDLVYDMNIAYLLDFAAMHRDEAHYTILLEAGMRLRNDTMLIPQNFTAAAIDHYSSTVSSNQRVCWTMISAQYHWMELPAIMIETAEHASRMAITLRSALPYRVLRARNILTEYCARFLWNARAVMGPRLFAFATPPQYPDRTPMAVTLFNASQLLPTPTWIDPDISVGPMIRDERSTITRRYRIVFGAPTMMRPNNITAYLEQFMTEIVDIVQTDFAVMNGTEVSYDAVVLLLICGKSVAEIATHRLFLQSKYGDVVSRGIVRLVDAPIESYPSLHNLRPTFPEDTPERQYWRSKQNLDVSATLQAMDGMSEYLMLLEDDTGFQLGFASRLKDFVTAEYGVQEQRQQSPAWSVLELGFGYSGIVLHYSDMLVFERLHWTFYDEIPCDNLHFYSLVRRAERERVHSPHPFGNNMTSYLKHIGKISSLPGKSQNVWRRP